MPITLVFFVDLLATAIIRLLILTRSEGGRAQKGQDY